MLAAAADALINPARAKFLGLKDRHGNVTSLRNDGTTNAQVTPIYLVLQALNEIDQAFAQYAQANPKDAQRQTQWKRARSQLVDQFLDVDREEHADAVVRQRGVPTIIARAHRRAARAALVALPDASPLRLVLLGADEPLEQREHHHAAGRRSRRRWTSPTRSARTTPARTETETLLTYLLDAALEQRRARRAPVVGRRPRAGDARRREPRALLPRDVAGDGAHRPPTRRATCSAASSTRRSTLLARIAGRAYDAQKQRDLRERARSRPVLNVALGKLVTPMTGANGAPGETPLEVILDVIADVNRASPGASAKLAGDGLREHVERASRSSCSTAAGAGAVLRDREKRDRALRSGRRPADGPKGTRDRR